MKKTISVLLAVLVIIGVLPLTACNRLSFDPNDITTALPLNGLMVKSHQNKDFPSQPELSTKALRKEINDIIQYAHNAGYNAIFFEARSEGESLYKSSIFPRSQFLLKEQGTFTLFDPMKEMIKAATKKGLSVYAVVDPYSLGGDLSQLAKKHPAIKDPSLTTSIGEHYLLAPDNVQTIQLNAKDLGAMAKRYELGGIILENTHATDDMQSEVTSLIQSCREAIDGRTQIGLMLPDAALEGDYSAAIALSDIVLPTIKAEVNPTDSGYANRLAEWQRVAGEKLTAVIDLNNSALSAVQLSAQGFDAVQSGVAARVVTNYSAARSRTDFAGDLLASAAIDNAYQPTALNYAPLQSLSVTRPTSAITVNTASYCITGTSDPALPLTLDGQTIERSTNDGVFAVLVSLKYGDNTFVLQQGDRSETVTITRPDGSGPAATTINVTAMTPRSSLLAYNGVEFAISCVAPAGKTVTATLGDTTVALKQNAVADPDVPAVFSGSMTLNGAGNKEVKNLGPVTYRIEGGETAVSGGNVYLLGHGATAFIRVTEFVASVFPDESVAEGNYKSVYKAGVVEEITDQMGEYYALASGGYIKKATVEVVDSSVAAPLVLTAVSEQHNDRAEQFVLTGLGGVPYTFVDDEDGRCTVTLHQANATVNLNSPPTESALFSKIQWTNDGNGLTCTLTPRDAKKVWGIDILNHGNDAILYAKYAPKISDIPGKPMTGVVVVLDPGHGGTDSGAPSVLGASGPYERDVNLANAQMLKKRLEQLGATVVMTRTDSDTTLSLYDRMETAQNTLPDFFMSLHHNSVAESQDANINSGVEAYYYEPFSRDFAEAATRGIADNVYARDYRFSDWSYYTVTRMRYAPSILCEIGFMPNPTEFKNVCNLTEIHKTADALALAMLNLIATAS
ncbi:N-acetylmuramoyl-L-alanine amidase [Oscillospiraceae bacterium LTW-04]|nr:N-acetylmuramoyl-L-alanine amidase [Oscillospiraceae bacterium MB24-C1]